jgi:hypothetical protein
MTTHSQVLGFIDCPPLEGANARTQAWLNTLRGEDLDEAFLDNLLVLRETLRSRPAEGRREARRRLEGLAAMAARVPAGGATARRIGTKGRLIQDLLDEKWGRAEMPVQDAGTAETRVRRQGGDPIARMLAAGRIDDAQAEAARRLRRVVEGIMRPVMAHSPRIDGVHGVSGASGAGRLVDLMPGELAWEHSRLYLPWSREVASWTRRGGYRPVDLVLDVVVMDLGLDAARRKHRCALDTAQRDLGDALTLYAKRAGVGRYRRQTAS